jgi:hypothetical protein
MAEKKKAAVAVEADSLDRLMKLFAGFAGAHGTHGVPRKDPNSLKWEIKSTARTLREPVTRSLWEQHVAGTRPLGVMTVMEDSCCVWGSIDHDVYDENLLELVGKVDRARLPLLPCRSKSGGLHLFMFTSEPVQAALMQSVLRALAAQLGVANSEIFPKQTTILVDRGDLPNWMVMPYFGGTFDGKLQKQVGIKKTGSEMNLKEFLSTAEKMRMTELGQASANPHRPVARTASPGTGGKRDVELDLSGDAFSDGPPCLQHLAREGVEKGGQSNALMQMGVYFKKKEPASWKEELGEAGREHLTPPSSAEGLQTVVRSLEKKDYEYMCKVEPMLSHCNSAVCRTRKYGVGGGEVYPVIHGLSKLNTDDPVWFVEVDGGRLELTTTELQNYQLFHRACMDKVHKCYRLMAQKDWFAALSAAMASLVVDELPPDISQEGRFKEMLEEFLTNRQRGERREDLLSGRPWEDEERGIHHFRMRDLKKFLEREGQRNIHEAKYVGYIKRLGGERGEWNLKGGFVRWWGIPSSRIRAAPELSPPAEKESGI